MKNNKKKQWAIIGVIALIIIIGYAIFINLKVIYWKHQNIAYEQYKAEDLRQARLYNSTFADNEEEFKEKIKDFPETDQVIAKALYEIKPEIVNIKETLKNDLQTKEQITATRESQPHNILNDTRTTLYENGISTIEQYIQKFNIKGTISQKEYAHLRDLFVTGGNGLQIAEVYNAIERNGITVSETNSDFSQYEYQTTQLEEANQRIETNKKLLSEIRIKYNELITNNSTILEYQDTITTNGIKSAIDYLLGDEYE